MSPKVFVFGPSESLYGDYSGDSTIWSQTGLKTKPVFDVNPDSKNKTILFEEQEEGKISEVKLDSLSNTEFSISGIENASSVQVDAILGDVYVISKYTTTQGNKRFWGGDLYRQKKEESSPVKLSVLNGTTELRFFRPQDMKIDSPRRKLWIADTGNHRLISVNLETLSASMFEFDNLMFCCGIAINSTNGSVLSRWFDSETLKERIVLIDKNGLNASYSSFSDFPWGDLSSDRGRGDLLLIESIGNNKGIYSISANGSSRVLKYKSLYKTPVSISVEPIYGMISVLYSNGTVAGFSNEIEFLQENSFAPDSKNTLFPSFYGLGHWSGNYKGYFNSHLPINTRMEPAHISEIQKASAIHGFEAGVCSFSDMRLSFIANNGLKMVTLSKDCKTILNETVFDFDSKKYLITQDAKNGDTFVSSTVSIEHYDKNHNKIRDIFIPSTKVISIDSKHDGLGGIWALTASNEIFGIENGEISSYIQIPSSSPLKSVKHDMATGGVWTNSKNSIYKISSNGQTIIFSKSGFKNINGIAPRNYLADLYESDTPFTLSRSMMFDGIRNQAWWISNPEKHLVGMMNFTSNTGSVLRIASMLQSSSSSSTKAMSSSSNSSLSSVSSPSSSSLSSESSSFSSVSSTSSVLEEWSVLKLPNYIVITGYLGNEKDIEIPDMLSGLPVRILSNSAFEGKDFTSAIIPDSVEYIGSSAFKNCIALASISIGNGVKEIYSNAFEGCSSISDITIPSEVTTIGIATFKDCSNLSNVVFLGDKITIIASQLFENCTSLSSFTIPSSIKFINASAFSGSGLTSVNIPIGIEQISSRVFFNCPNIASVTVDIGNPNFHAINDILYNTTQNQVIFCPIAKVGSITIQPGTMQIAADAFYNCSTITNIDIPEGVSSIGNYAFYNCIGLNSINLPDGITSIGASAFYNLQITSFIIPETVTTIGSNAFESSKIQNFYIPDSVTSIGSNAFYNCLNLNSFAVGELNTAYSDDSSILFSKDKKTLIKCPRSKTGPYTIPLTVETISNYAFHLCNNLTSIIIPSNVKTIGYAAFLSALNISSISLSSGLITIGDHAFRSTKITGLNIPASVTTIGAHFILENWLMTSISVDAGNPNYSSYDDILYNKLKTSLIICPGGKIGSHTIPVTTTEIKNYAFYGSKLTSVSLPVLLNEIEYDAFNSSNITGSIQIPASVTSIGDDAFVNCQYLTDFIVAPGNINYKAVDGVLLDYEGKIVIHCPRGKLGSYDIPSSVTSIKDNAFYNCSGLTSVIFSYSIGNPISSSSSESPTTNGVSSIGDLAFYHCSNLTSLILPESLISLGGSCFQECLSLTSITFNGNAPTLGNSYVFWPWSPTMPTTAYYYAGATGFNSEWITKAGIPVTEI